MFGGFFPKALVFTLMQVSHMCKHSALILLASTKEGVIILSSVLLGFLAL